MHPAIRFIGRVLSMVGISSPEDNAVKTAKQDGPPSWRNRAEEAKTALPVEPPTR